MKGYRKAARDEIKCEDCKHGWAADAPREWHQCYYYSHVLGGAALGKVSKRATCDHATPKVDTPSGEMLLKSNAKAAAAWEKDFKGRYDGST